MLNTGVAGSIRESCALAFWSAKQIRRPAAYRLWYVKHVLRGEPELRMVPALCDRERMMLDVGANRGMYAAAALRFSKGVVAFEPQPHLAAIMRKCLPRTVEIVECAVSDTTGVATLFVPLDPRGHAEARIIGPSEEGGRNEHPGVPRRVPTIVLDQAVDRPVGLIKIDVEGHEIAVLRGATGIIDRFRPNIIIELEDRHRAGTVGWVWNWFAAKGYEGFRVKAGRLVRVVPQSVPRSAADDEYIYNFIFLPRERKRPVRAALYSALTAVMAL
ncbi:MAG TPA: FkbM family methyltransferase [Xanthobacteraceae bacterium]|jgi:FkbM family methyltransferase